MAEPLTIIGNGMASVRLCEELLARCPGRYAVTVIGEEPEPAYNRVLLSSLLARDIAEADADLRGADWYARNGIRLETGRRAESLAGIAGKIVLATGSTPIRLPLPGAELPGVLTFRDKRDVEALRAIARPGARVAVIGGGLLGLEAAWGVAKAGAQVTIVHLMDRLMERQLDPRGAAVLRRALERKGLRFALKADTAAIEGCGKVEALRLKDGARIACDAVILAVGVRPRVDLAKASGLAVNRGIVVDDGLAANQPDVFAIGECAEHRGQVYGLVEPAYAQAAVLAARLAGEEAGYQGSVLSTNLKVSGVSVFSAGDFLGEGAAPVVFEDAASGHYRRLTVMDNKLAGAVLVGEASDALWYAGLIRAGASVSAFRDRLIFGEAFCGGAPRAEAA